MRAGAEPRATGAETSTGSFARECEQLAPKRMSQIFTHVLPAAQGRRGERDARRDFWTGLTGSTNQHTVQVPAAWPRLMPDAAGALARPVASRPQGHSFRHGGEKSAPVALARRRQGGGGLAANFVSTDDRGAAAGDRESSAGPRRCLAISENALRREPSRRLADSPCRRELGSGVCAPGRAEALCRTGFPAARIRRGDSPIERPAIFRARAAACRRPRSAHRR